MRTPPIWRLLAALVALALLAAACVDDDPAGTDETREERLEETPFADEDEPLEEGLTEDDPEAVLEEEAVDDVPEEEEGAVEEETVDGEPVEPGEGEEVTPIGLIEFLQTDGRFSTLLSAVEAAGLGETLAASDSVTLFAPTDEAFAALPEGALDDLLADPAALEQLLLYHTLPVAQDSEVVGAFSSLVTLQGGRLAVTADGETVMVDDATIVETDLEAGNGVIHVIDTVLQPPADDEA